MNPLSPELAQFMPQRSDCATSGYGRHDRHHTLAVLLNGQDEKIWV
jgi:hypothetical protein